MITERAMLRLDRGGPPTAEVAPPVLFAELQRAWPTLRAGARARAAVAFAGDDESARVLRRSAELDAVHVGVASLDALGPRDLLAVYLPGLDIAQHELLGVSGAGVQPASAVAERVEALSRYYDYLDGLLEPLLEPGAETLIVVVTHPGRVANQGGAILAVAGGAAHAGARLEATLVHVAPTVLYALGFPMSRELAGRPRPAAVQRNVRRATPRSRNRHLRAVRGAARPAGTSGVRRRDARAAAEFGVRQVGLRCRDSGLGTRGSGFGDSARSLKPSVVPRAAISRAARRPRAAAWRDRRR